MLPICYGIFATVDCVQVFNQLGDVCTARLASNIVNTVSVVANEPR